MSFVQIFSKLQNYTDNSRHNPLGVATVVEDEIVVETVMVEEVVAEVVNDEIAEVIGPIRKDTASQELSRSDETLILWPQHI